MGKLTAELASLTAGTEQGKEGHDPSTDWTCELEDGVATHKRELALWFGM